MAPKKALDRKRQTKINFSSPAQSSPATKSTATTTMGTSPSRPNLTAMRPKRRTPSGVAKNNKQESSSEDELATGTQKAMLMGMPVGSTARGMFDGSNNASASSKTSEEEEQVPVKESKSRKRRRAATPSESEDEEPTVTVIRRKRQRRIEIGSDSSEKPKKKKKKDKKHRKRRERKESTPEEEEEEDEPLTPAPRSRRIIVRKPSPSTEEEEEEEERGPPRSVRRRLKRRKSPSEGEEEPSATPEPTKPRSRGDAVSDEEDSHEAEGRANDQEDDEEQDELEEELAFLKSSPPPDRGRLRSTQDKPKNKRQEALEALKRRRAGTTESSAAATPGRKRAVVVETESESELEVIKEEPDSDLEMLEQDDIEDDEQEESDRDANALDMFQEDQEDEQFIDDDPDNVIGEPSVNADLDEMRLAFSLSRAKTRDLFRHAVEWMVMKKIHPAFDSNKNVYTLTFRKLDDEVKGLAGSKYTSSAWTADFTRAICARPFLIMNELSAAEKAVMAPHCEACNRRNHTASFELLLQGQPYHPKTLEPLDNASDSDSDADSDNDSDSSGLSSDSESLLNGEKPTYNYQNDRIPPESHRFPLGSTCKANAQVAHTLYHWRYNLYQWVKDYLGAEGHLTAEKLVKRDGWSDWKREKAARKIVDVMEATGQIKQLYHSYKHQLTAAMEADNDYANGWGRRG